MTHLNRAARALYALTPQTIDTFTRDCADPKAGVSKDSRPIEWADLADEDRSPFVKAVRAVLTAIREPSEGMVEAGQENHMDLQNDDQVPVIFTAMIDAALAEGA